MNRNIRRFALPIAGLIGAGTALCLLRRWPSGTSAAGQVVLITGGSRGLGLELAREWATHGARVAICARTAADLRRAVDELQAAGHEAIALACDVTSQQQVSQMVEHVVRRWGRIDVLVNNAGIIQVGPQECTTTDDFQKSLDTHFWAPYFTIGEVLPHMRGQRGGSIVNVASIGGKISVPHLLPYSVGKFALVGYSEGLAAELAKDNIRVTTVCPGLMRTGSPRNAKFKGQHRAEYAWFSISDSMPLVSINSRRAARQIVRACRLGRRQLYISPAAKIGIRLHGMFPGLAIRALGLVNRLLPGPGGVGQLNVPGEQSTSAWSPSQLTWLNERAAERNNEIR